MAFVELKDDFNNYGTIYVRKNHIVSKNKS